jgi:hypothetical protein
MVPSTTAILQRFTPEWAALLPPEALLAVCTEIGYTAGRDRVRTPVPTRQLFLGPMMPGHPAGHHRPPLAGWRFRAVAYGPARTPRPLPLVARLLARFGRAVPPAAWEEGRWPGPRPVCGTGLAGAMPETPA